MLTDTIKSYSIFSPCSVERDAGVHTCLHAHTQCIIIDCAYYMAETVLEDEDKVGKVAHIYAGGGQTVNK